MKVRGFWVWGPEPGEEEGVGSSRRVRFSWAGEEEWGRLSVFTGVLIKALFFCLYLICQAICLSFSLAVYLSASVRNTTSWIWGCATAAALCLSGTEMETHPGS